MPQQLKPSTAGTFPRQSTGRRALLALATAAALILAMALAATGASAAYTNSGELSSGKYTSSVAVNQATRNVYVARAGSFSLPPEAGGFAAFDSSGGSIACTLTPPPALEHPGSVAVNEHEGEAGNLYVLDINTQTTTRLRTYSEDCGEEKGSFAGINRNTHPVPQIASDGEGNVYIPAGTNISGTSGVVQKCTPAGTCTNLITGLSKPSAVALDAAGHIFAATGTEKCSNVANGRLKEYEASGTLIGEPVPGLTEVASVAIDRSTGDIFIGRGCGSGFRIEKYSEGGTLLDEFGSGVFGAGGNTTTEVIYNQLAVDQTSGTVYATDTGHEKVQVFEPEAEPEPVTLTVTPAAVGNVHSVPAGAINCSSTASNCSQEYLEGEEVTLVATQPSGSTFAGWSGCEPDGVPSGRTCVLTMEGNETVEATYSSTHTVSVTLAGAATGNVHSSPFGINCGAGSACSASYANGTPVALTATQPAGTTFTGWTGCDSASGRTCNVTMSANKAVEAHWASTKLLTVTLAGGPHGNVWSSPGGINCGTGLACSHYYETGEVVTLTATQPAGTHFEAWSGNPCLENPSPRKCVIEMSAAKEVIANYE